MKRIITHLHTILFGKPTKCPYCHSTDITASRGHWECFQCGKEGSY